MGAPNPGWSLPFTGVTPNRALNGLAANTLDWNTIGTHNCRCREYDFTKLVDMFLMISAYPNLKETLRLLPDLFSLHPLGKAALSRMPGASWCFQVKANLRFDFFSWAIFIYVLYELLVPLSSSPHPSKTSICTHHRTPRVPRVTDLKTPPPPSLSCTRHPPTAPRPQNHHVNLPVQGSPSAAGSAQAPPPRFWFNWPQGGPRHLTLFRAHSRRQPALELTFPDCHQLFSRLRLCLVFSLTGSPDPWPVPGTSHTPLLFSFLRPFVLVPSFNPRLHSPRPPLDLLYLHNHDTRNGKPKNLSQSQWIQIFPFFVPTLRLLRKGKKINIPHVN